MPLAVRRYDYWPEDLLDALDALLAYLLGRAPVRPPHRVNIPGRSKGNWRRCLYGWKWKGKRSGNLAWAQYVLNVNYQRKHMDGRPMWRLGARWRYRLGLAGIDPDTLQIVDQPRFNLCWEQLFEFDGKFYAAVQLQRIAQGRVASAATARNEVATKRIKGLPKPKRKKVSELVGRENGDSPYTTWLRHRIKAHLTS